MKALIEKSIIGINKPSNLIFLTSKEKERINDEKELPWQ
jgi:hypothetical protein